MKKPIHLDAAVREVTWPLALWMMLMFVPPLILLGTGEQNGALIGMAVGLVVGVSTAIFFTRKPKAILKGRGAIATDEGIGPTLDGTPLWILPWTRFGGYKLVRVSDWRRTWHPEEEGAQLFDNQGLLVGVMNTSPTVGYFGTQIQATGLLARRDFFWQEVDAHVPEGGPRYVKPPIPETSFKRATPQKVTRQISLGAILTAAAFTWIGVLMSAVDSEAPGSWQSASLSPLGMLAGSIVFCVGIYEASMGFLGLAYLRNRQSNAANPIEPPQEGPSYLEYLAIHGGLPKNNTLIEGVRYVQVHPCSRRRQFKSGKTAGLLGLIMFGGFYASSMFVSIYLFLGVSLGYVPMTLICWYTWRNSSTSLENLDDVVLLDSGGLVVVKPDGSHLSFSPNAKRKPAAKLLRMAFGDYETWREGNKHYVLDLGHLMPSEVQIEGETLKQLEQEFRD